MKLFILALFLTFWAFSLITTPVLGQSSKIQPTPVPTPTTTLLKEDIVELRAEVEKLRDENYKRAISAAESATGHADRLILWITGIATIYGVILATLSIVVGGDLYRKLKELGGHVKTAKKNALLIAGLSEQAQTKGQELKKLVVDINKYKREIEKTKGETSEQRKEFDGLLNKAQGTIADIEALKNSASFISGATVSPGNIGSISGLSLEPDRCARCRKPLSLSDYYVAEQENVYGVGVVGTKICQECRRREQGL